MSRHLSTRNISSKSMHTFFSNLANIQTDRQTRAKTFTSSFVEGKQLSEADVNVICGPPFKTALPAARDVGNLSAKF